MTDSPTLVTFWVEEREYAFDVGDVIEVLPAREVTRVPNAPAHVAGVVTWRGRTIPIVDLRARLKDSAAASEGKNKLMVLGRPERFAVAIDRAGEILPGGVAEILRPPGEATGEGNPAVALVRTPRGHVRILDPLGVAGGELGAVIALEAIEEGSPE